MAAPLMQSRQLPSHHVLSAMPLTGPPKHSTQSRKELRMSKLKILTNGIIKENPTLVLILGMCPPLAVTTSAINGLGMGLATTFVLLLSNLMISLLRKVIPDGVRIPAFIVVIATFVTVIQLLLQGYIPSLYASL